MATLPAINRSNQSHNHSPKSKSRNKVKFMTWKELEAAKQQEIRDANPTVTRVDASTYRNSYKQNLCVSMLKAGFHKSFEELFSLIERRKEERLSAGADSVLWQELPLDDQEDKMDKLWEYLTKAESASRHGRWEEIFTARSHLANYFLKTGDVWLSDYFFKTALEISYDVRMDGRRREAEANCSMGLACERRGDFEMAASHMEEFFQLSMGRSWVGESGISHSLSACRHLSRLCSTLAERSQSPSTATPLLHRSLHMAREGKDPMQIAQAALKLGRNYEQTRDSETAIQYLTETLEIAQSLEDDVIVGEACDSLAQSYLTQGNAPRAIECLELFAKTSRSNQLSSEFIEACSSLGKIYNSTGWYSKAVDHFEAAYQESNAIIQNDPKTQVQLGIAMGNEMLNSFKRNMRVPKPLMMSRIATWKDQRSNEFGNPIPSSPITLKPDLIAFPDPTQPFREVLSTSDVA